MFQSPNNTFDSLIKKLREIYQQNIDNASTIDSKTNDVTKIALELNFLSNVPILFDTRDPKSQADLAFTPGFVATGDNPSPDVTQAINFGYFYAKNIDLPSDLFYFIDYETSVNPGPSRGLTPSMVYTPDAWMPNYLRVVGHDTFGDHLLIQGVPQISSFVSTDPKVFTIIGNIFPFHPELAPYLEEVVVTDAHIAAGNVDAAFCQIQLSGPLAGKYIVFYDTAFTWAVKINQETYGYSLDPLGLPFNFTGFSTLPYLTITVETNPGGNAGESAPSDPTPDYPLKDSEYFGPQPQTYITVNFSSDIPVYFRMSKTTDNKEKWQVNLFFNGLITAQGDTLSQSFAYPDQDDTYTQTSSPDGDLTKYSYSDTIMNHGTKYRTTFMPSLNDATVRIRGTLRPPFNWKENRKFNTQVT